MEDNGSLPPRFDFDQNHRSYFRVILPAHPEYIAIGALRDAAYLQATGDEQRALARIREAWEAYPTSALLAASLIREYAERQDLEAARNVHDRSAAARVPGYAGVATAMADAYLDAGRRTDALTVLDRLPTVLSPVEAFDAAILERRAKREKRAHGYFQRAGGAVLNDVRALHEFAQCKIKLTAETWFALHTTGKNGILDTTRKNGTLDPDCSRRPKGFWNGWCSWMRLRRGMPGPGTTSDK